MLSLDKMHESKFMGDLFEVEDDAYTPRGGAAEIGIEDELIRVRLSIVH